MLLNKVYYILKPLIPWSARIGLRRMRAKMRHGVYSSIWPIDPKAGATPPGWPGWPEGKKFAFVLTHDVEITKGYSRVEQLMQVEMKYGFRSSFNFVPERTYQLNDALRQTLSDAGFEASVHGLKHDGKLYATKAEFAARALHIREYFERWETRGFRSPLMQHKLQWMHLLGADYDESTFDTDPFEPEPDAARTIFPFWVSGPKGGGFVELPYSLPQDFTLFTILREKNIDIWKRKLDWVVERGGMALINVHPDYITFEGPAERDEFPVAFYEEFLRYARDAYGDRMWHALPREVSEYYRTAIPTESRNTRKKICMVAYTAYEDGASVQRYAGPLAGRGDDVEVIALVGANEAAGSVEVNGITLHRIRPAGFLRSASRLLARRQEERKYDLIHVHNLPDFVVPRSAKRAGAKVIFALDEDVPLANLSSSGTNRPVNRPLSSAEKKACQFADHVIVSSPLQREALLQAAVPVEKCSLFAGDIFSGHVFKQQAARSGQNSGQQQEYRKLVDTLTTERFDDGLASGPVEAKVEGNVASRG